MTERKEKHRQAAPPDFASNGGQTPLASAPVRWLAYHASRLACKFVLLPVSRIAVFHRNSTRIRGAWILAANHISHFDPPIIGVAARRKIDWMAMQELFENPVSAAWLRGIDTFPVNRTKVDRTAVRTSLDRLARGHVVGMFPEGGLRHGEYSVLSEAPMRPGVGAIAQLSNVPVVPCVIVGSDRLYTPCNWIPLRRARIYVGFGKPLTCRGGGKSAREGLERQLGDELRRVYGQMRERYGLSADDFPHSPQYRKGREE